MKQRVKIGTHSVQVIECQKELKIGDRFLAPFPTGGQYTAIVTDINENCIFAEWI